MWHVRFRIPRGHPHKSTVGPCNRTRGSCEHDSPARLRLAMGFGSEEVVAISPLCPKHRLDAAHSEQVKRKRPVDRDINATHDFWAPLRMRSGAGGLMSRR